MTSSGGRQTPTMSKYKLSRRGKKLQMSDDQRTLVALPKDVPERTWADILQKEEIDLMILDIREEIIEEVSTICYKKYMMKQNALFTAHCAAEAWLKLINWYFFRHDPGEDPSAYPSCFIPNRKESWVPDELPDPSPKDTWCKQELSVQEDFQDDTLKKCPSSSSLDIPLIEDIPKEYWFPGKINLQIDSNVETETSENTSYDSESSLWSRNSEQLQRVTDYSEPRLTSQVLMLSPDDKNLRNLSNGSPVSNLYLMKKDHRQDYSVSAMDSPSANTGSLKGAGDAEGLWEGVQRSRKRTEKTKPASKASITGRSKAILPPLEGDSRSRISIISDCRLRNLRLDTQYEITSEKIDTPPGEMVKRK